MRFERPGANATAPTTSIGKYEQTAYTGDVGSFARADDLFATRRNDIVLSNYKEPCCFAAGTKVSTPNGDRTIESLKVGDVVWSKPEKGGKPFAAKILATHQRTDQPIYRLKLKSVRSDGKAQGETLLVTPGHPFYVPAKRDFISVIDLKPGDLLQSLADGDTDNTSSEVESLELYLPVGETYNLTVDVGHTFYVGDLKTWVHNTGPCALPEGYFEAKAADTAKVRFADGKIAGEASELLVKPAPVHHICTNKNCVSTARGGPWTPKFEAIFTRAGLDLDDAINKVAVPGHKGPHPQDYHAYIYDQLQSATVGVPANTSAYKNAIELTLERIKVEAVTPGSQVNRWLRKE